MEQITKAELRKIVDKSELCNTAWEGIDSSGELTTEEGVKEANKLRDKLVDAIYRRLVQ